MHPLTTSGVGQYNKRRRAADKVNRRFSIKDTMKKKEIIPLTHTPPVGRKTKNARNGFRFLAFVALFFVSLSTISVWRKRILLHRHATHFQFAPSSHDERAADHVADDHVSSDHYSARDDRGAAPVEAQHPVSSGSASGDVAVGEDTSSHAGGNAAPPAKDIQDEKKDAQQASNFSESSPVSSGSSAANVASSSSSSSAGSESDSKKANDGGENDPNEDNVTEEKPTAQEEHKEESKPDEGPPVIHEEPVVYEELPDRIEWYTRGDFKEGTRPLCRISHPYILSNGTILFPQWMEEYDRLLARCGISTPGFYSTKEPPSYIQKINKMDVDFALTLHLARFQEPTHDPSVYLTEHILKASYLFDVFSGHAGIDEAIREDHCYTYANDSERCTPGRPGRTALKPGLFVPKRIETGSKDSWSYKAVNMFGAAYGHGRGVTHLNISSILSMGHAGRSENLTGTHFRSIMTMDGMFRHLPIDGLKYSHLYSNKTGVDKTSKQFVQNGKCGLTIGIISIDGPEGVAGVTELQNKLDVLTKFAIPDSSIDVRLVKIDPSTGLSKHMREMQKIDIFLGRTGQVMNSIAFMRPSSTVYELMPFGIQPDTHESFARALGMNFESIQGKPQTAAFKKCIDGEVFNLRKKGKLKFTALPDWHEPLMKAWTAAVAEFTKTGSSNFNVLKEAVPIRNSHSRNCAAKQTVEVGLDDSARKIILTAKAKCGTPKDK